MKSRTWIFILVSLLPVLLVACSNNGSGNVDDTTDTVATEQQDTLAVPTQRIIIDIEKLKAPDKALPTVGYDKIISTLNSDTLTRTNSCRLCLVATQPRLLCRRRSRLFRLNWRQ